ncbi:MAG TPA: ATP-binding protein [Allosphingosinicella sp.]|nr:ATP-binding protein [Allosphingosinicella sp.]
MNKAWRALEPDPLEGMADRPYPGLRPFLPRERDVFFGREQMVDQVLVRLNERHMVVVHGASGCGKSSLIAAGVLPQLARRRARRGLKLRTGTFRPGIKPMQALVGLLQELCATEAGPAALEEVYRAIANGPEARSGVARLAGAAGVDQLCIVVDQFEELFRFAEDEGFEEAQLFAELLVQLCGCYENEAGWWEAEGEATAPPRDADGAEISFILTMRSEFLGNCARYRGLAEAINHTQYLLPNMARDDLIRAIREPAEVFEGSVDHALAERMADDAAREQDALPLVQHALMQMWRATGDRTLDLSDYARALEACAQSEQAQARAPLSAILAGHADRVLEEVTGGGDTHESAAEFLFRALTRKDSESRAIRCPQRFRRLARLSGVSREETIAIIDGFRREGVSFLTPYAEMGGTIEDETVVDISHEALIRAWPRMSDKAIDPETAQPVGWVEREAQDAMLWRWLSVHAQFFETNPQAYLDGATSERLGAWFERIRERPDWARAHLVRPAGADDVTEEPEWKAVARLLKASHDKTWLDRTMLKRWRKLGWSSLALLIVLVAGIVWAGNWAYHRLAEGESASNAQQAAARQQAAAKQQIAASLRATDQFIWNKNQDRAPGRPALQTEAVEEGVAAHAIAGPGGVATATNVTQGFVWIGTTGPDGEPTSTNLLGDGGDFRQAARVGARVAMKRNSVLRAAFPAAGGELPPSIGLIAGTSQVRIVERASLPSGEGIEHWARVDFRLEPAPRVRLDFGSDSAGAAASFSGQLASLGYHPLASSRPSAAEGAAEAVYCAEPGRAAAYRLAVQTTRWLAEFPGMQNVVVSPRLDPACGGGAASPLVLRVHFPRPPAAWINGQWGRDGDCLSRVTIQADARQLTSTFDGQIDTFTIGSATDTLIVAGRRRYALAGDTVTVSGELVPYRLKRCGR